ncbi:hypothetical protein [Billgrantia montanilacus]|uniref:Phage late control D family protein n=1 Tax=Billgrantia montanilacus TaxID=2282305 RepID=A0A368TWS4_9GAMM|nr:hypothetical protein [Halomonas montanilacus]RCV89154.1 hypothetical protein DU505_11395 [Halomonas montanilacus]
MIKGIDLSLLFGPGVPVAAPRAVIEALQSVKIEENAGAVQSGFDLIFALDKDSPLNTLFLLAGGSALPILRVALMATINGRATALINGVVTRTDLNPGSGGAPSTLSVKGKDLTATMDEIDFSGIPYPAMPPVARVALILAKYAWLGVIPQVIPSLEGPPLPTEKIPRHQGTDLAYIRSLAEKAGYTFFMKPGPAPATSIAYWGPEIRIGEVQPALTVDSGFSTNTEEMSFSFDKEGVEIPVVYIQNPQTKVPIPVPIPSSIPFQPPLGLVPPIPPKIARLQDTARLNPMEALVRGFAHAAQHSDAVSGRGSIDVLRYGRILRARNLVGVRGAGRAFDGVHYVDSVTHDLSRGSYRQSFTLKRSGLLPARTSVSV